MSGWGAHFSNLVRQICQLMDCHTVSARCQYRLYRVRQALQKKLTENAVFQLFPAEQLFHTPQQLTWCSVAQLLSGEELVESSLL